MSLVKGAMLLLLLAVIGINAAPGPEDCDGLNKTLSAQDLHKICGDWLLVWAVTDNSSLMLADYLISTEVQIRLLDDNQTIEYKERNDLQFLGEKSVLTYVINMSRPADPLEAKQYLLDTGDFTGEENGVVTPQERGKINVFESCDDCMVVDYQGTSGHFLLMYRKEGSNLDLEHLKASHSAHQKLAECVGLAHDKPFIYKTAAIQPDPEIQRYGGFMNN